MSYIPPFVHIDDVTAEAYAEAILVNRQPYPDQINVETDSLIKFDIVDGFLSGINLGSLNVTINGVDAIIGGVIQAPYNGGSSGITTFSVAGWVRVVLDYIGDGISLSECEINVTCTTGAGSLDETYKFTYEDKSQPQLHKVKSVNRNLIRVTYSQEVIDTASSVSIEFPPDIGSQNLIFDGDRWKLNPLACPWTVTASSFNPIIPQYAKLDIKINDIERNLSFSVSTIDIPTCVIELNNMLNPYNVEAVFHNGLIYLHNLNYTGSLEILGGSANTRLNFELGNKTQKLIYNCAEGEYSLLATITLASGAVFTRDISYELTNKTSIFILEDIIETFNDSVTDASNYSLDYDQEIVLNEINPTYIPNVINVSLLTSNIVELETDADLTQNGPYILNVSNVYDLNGNVIDPEYSSASFRGYVPETDGNRNFDIYTFFAGFNRNQDTEVDFVLKKFCAVLQELSIQLLSDMDEHLDINDITLAKEWGIEGMLASYGNPFTWFNLSLTKRRQLVRLLVDLYRRKGTEEGIKSAIKFFFGIDPINFIYYWGTGWMLGDPVHSILAGEAEPPEPPSGTTELNAGLLRMRYSFSIEFFISLTETQKWQIRRLVDIMKPAHTHFIDILEPEIPFTPDHWQLPFSELAIETILH